MSRTTNADRRIDRLAVRFLLLLNILVASKSNSDVTRIIHLQPGSSQETSALLVGNGTTVDGDARRADLGGSFTYRIVVTPGARVVFRFDTEGEPGVIVAASDGKPIVSRIDRSESHRTLHATAPMNHPLGGGLRFQFVAKTGPIAIRGLTAEIIQPDLNGDGLPDAVSVMMGVPPGKRAMVLPRPTRPQTTFQTGGPFDPTIAVPADAVLAYSSDSAVIQSWADHGYVVQTMGGFRDGPEYVKLHPDEVQRDRAGEPLSIGNSFYTVPTTARTEIAKQFFAAALTAGSLAVCPEEPEFATRAGYSDSFKKEWEARYGKPWEPPHSSIDARYRSEQLKGFLEKRQLESILSDAQARKPAAARMAAVHSPVTYYQWGYSVPHAAILGIPALQEIIGQVWTGTARTPNRVGGVRTERTFELAYLEYSSLANLTRGTDKRLWFLMDPVEDNPDRSLDDYRANYEQTLTAAMMFPQVDSFEVMPWPKRVYERIPAGYATVINTVAGVLADLWRFPGGQVDAGCEGFGVFVSDSMAWQRGDPAPSDYDGFYGLCMPLATHGVPIQVLSLDRVREPGYLSRIKTIFLSYDYLKPENADLNRALADWTKRGGQLVIFGGTDPYDGLTDSWWKKLNVPSPLDDLFSQLGESVKREPGAESHAGSEPSLAGLTTVLSGDATEHNLRNRRQYSVDLTPFAQANGSVVVRFEDVSKGDDWGAWLASAELRIGNRLAASFRTGSDLETRFLAEESGTKFDGSARFADRTAYWIYRFDNLPYNHSNPNNTPIRLTLDMGNGYLVKAGPAGPRPPLLQTTDKTFDSTVQRLRVPPSYAITRFTPPPAATPLYAFGGETTPVAWEAKAGDGGVTFVGIAPGYLTSTAQTSRWMRALAKRAYERTGKKYEEQRYFLARRGPYAAVHTLGEEYQLDGTWVNLLSPTLAVVEDPTVPARSNGLFQKISGDAGEPRVLAVSGRLRAKAELAATTGFLVQAPAKTEGVARLSTGGRRAIGAKAYTTMGEPVTVSLYPDGDSLLVRYPNDPSGVAIKVAWQ